MYKAKMKSEESKSAKLLNVFCAPEIDKKTLYYEEKNETL